jgi:aerobic-type carbon monoxide dehydrogenase small subunit (CoxS/CutS family)
MLPVGAVADAPIATLEGLGTVGKLHPVQHALLEE